MVVRQSFVMSLLLASTLWAGGAFGVDKTPVATRLSAAQPAEWDSILDTATLAQVELALGFSGPAPPWAGRAGLRLVRGLAHVGQRGAALISVDGGASRNKVKSCRIGVDVDGLVSVPNSIGIDILSGFQKHVTVTGS